MIINISLQNTTFIILMIAIILTIAVILTILMLIIIEKKHKRLLISFDFDLKNLIIFINHISHRDKFKRFKYISFFL